MQWRSITTDSDTDLERIAYEMYPVACTSMGNVAAVKNLVEHATTTTLDTIKCYLVALLGRTTMAPSVVWARSLASASSAELPPSIPSSGMPAAMGSLRKERDPTALSRSLNQRSVG